MLLAGGDIGAITEEFFNEHYEITSDDILTGHIASIFKLYQIRFSDNDFRRFLNEKRGEQKEVLSDEDFEKFKYLGIWSQIGADFVCFEPWYNTPDYVNSNKEFKEKKDIIELEPQKET